MATLHPLANRPRLAGIRGGENSIVALRAACEVGAVGGRGHPDPESVDVVLRPGHSIIRRGADGMAEGCCHELFAIGRRRHARVSQLLFMDRPCDTGIDRGMDAIPVRSRDETGAVRGRCDAHPKPVGVLGGPSCSGVCGGINPAAAAFDGASMTKVARAVICCDEFEAVGRGSDRAPLAVAHARRPSFTRIRGGGNHARPRRRNPLLSDYGAGQVEGTARKQEKDGLFHGREGWIRSAACIVNTR